ncbi:hypothetical protein [Staphylococcus aureus]|nr:hypothetical protein [Staphylococcus aureus]
MKDWELWRVLKNDWSVDGLNFGVEREEIMVEVWEIYGVVLMEI